MGESSAQGLLACGVVNGMVRGRLFQSGALWTAKVAWCAGFLPTDRGRVLSERPVVSRGSDYSGKWMAFAAIAAGQFVGAVDLGAVVVALFAAFRTRDPEDARETAVGP